jgi:quercetin dioxygenase-like cupin family protein
MALADGQYASYRLAMFDIRSLSMGSGVRSMCKSRRIPRHNLKATLVLLMAFCPLVRAADTTATPPPASLASLMTRDLSFAPDKEVVVLTVTYPGGATSLPHRHDAPVFVYVLEGQVTMQVRGSAAVTLKQSDTFYEAPEDVHLVSANASQSAVAKLLVVMIKDKGKPLSRLAD